MTRSFRSYVLEEWRGLPEKEETDRTVQAGPLIEQLVSRLGLSERISEGDILAAWRSIVGDFIAEHSVPTRLADGILHVQVLQPSVRYELDRTWRPEILRKLQVQFGKKTVRDLKLRT